MIIRQPHGDDREARAYNFSALKLCGEKRWKVGKDVSV